MYGLFVLLVAVLVLNPSLIKNMYGSILGRLLLLIIVIFFAMHNVTLGLFLVLVVIAMSQMYFKEGMTSSSVGDNITGAIPALTGNTSATKDNDTAKKLSDTLSQLQGVIASASASNTGSTASTASTATGKPDLLALQKTMQSKESFTMMGTTFKTHNPDVSAYSPAASFSQF